MEGPWSRCDHHLKEMKKAAPVRGAAFVRGGSDDETSMTAAKDAAVRRALETAGIEFIDENGGGPGVRLRKVSGLNSPNKQSLDDGLFPVLKRQIVTENSLGLEIRIRVSPSQTTRPCTVDGFDTLDLLRGPGVDPYGSTSATCGRHDSAYYSLCSRSCRPMQ
jgi:hypothetical protein